MNRQLLIISVLTLAGMIGLYVLLFKAYQLYQEKTAKGTIGGFLTSLAGS